MTSRPPVWPALLLERPFDGTYGDGHLHDPSQIRGFFPDTTFLGDIRSFNWDGGSDLSSADTGATEGVFIDMSLGSGQWMGDFFIGGDFQLISGGAIYTDDPTGTTFIALSNAKAATIDFKSGGNDGSIDLASGDMSFRVPTRYNFLVGGTTKAVLSGSALTLQPGVDLSLSGNTIIASGSDTDTFVDFGTADQISITAGNVEMLRLTEATTDVVTVGPSSKVNLKAAGGFFGLHDWTLTDDTLVTIASGAITALYSAHSLNTEGSAGTDDLDTINGGTSGDILVLRNRFPTRIVTVKDGTGNLSLAGDFALTTDQGTITLMKYGTSWLELSRSAN